MLTSSRLGCQPAQARCNIETVVFRPGTTQKLLDHVQPQPSGRFPAEIGWVGLTREIINAIPVRTRQLRGIRFVNIIEAYCTFNLPSSSCFPFCLLSGPFRLRLGGFYT